MKSLTKWIFLSLTWLALSVQAEPQAQPAPDFTLKDASGEDVSLSDYRGKVVILHFWATWCPYCKRLQPGLDALYKKYQQDGVELLGISFSEDADADPQGTLVKRGHKFKTLLKGGRVAGLYQVSGTPTTFFIDRNGLLRAVTMSSDPDEPGLEKMVQLLVNEK